MDAASSPQLPSECGRQQHFQPEGSTVNSISGLTAILIVFLSDVDFKGVEYIHISLMDNHANCKLYDQSGIPFIETINDDLEKAQKRGSKSGTCFYSLLVANYGGIKVVPMESPLLPRIPQCV